jgi:hypothetical protein
VNADSKRWQKNIGQDWGKYGEIESMTRALGDVERRGCMNWGNCISWHQIEQEIKAGKRPVAMPSSPLVGFYWQDKDNYRWERKVSYWNLPSLFHQHGAAYTAKQLWGYWNNLVVLKKPKSRGAKSQTYIARRSDTWMQAMKFSDDNLHAHGYEAPTSHEDRSIQQAHRHVPGGDIFSDKEPVLCHGSPCHPRP